MAFKSVLFKNDGILLKQEEPGFFKDLNLDKIVDNIIGINDDIKLKYVFYTHLDNINEIKYRQDIFTDLMNNNILSIIKDYYNKIAMMNGYLSNIESLYKYQKERWLLDSVEIYCEALKMLYNDLSGASIKSEGLIDFNSYVGNYIKSNFFIKLYNDTEKLKSELSKIRYSMHIKGKKVTVSRYKSEEDYNNEIENAFKKFSDTNSKNENTGSTYGMGHVEAALLSLVAKLYPDQFESLIDYYNKYKNFMDDKISSFNRDINFYLKYLKYIEKIKNFGLNFCMPEITEDKHDIYNYEGFNLALADKIKNETICNDFSINNNERIIVITGPNNGGKTTFARSFAQIHYLANLGLPVPGKRARLFLFDDIFTHFERSENVNNLRGKLEDDLIRIKNIMDNSTEKSIVIINEMLSSTTLIDAINIGRKIIDDIRKINCVCVYVTFIDELTSIKNTVSMVSQVSEENPEIRTHKIIREPANGLAYAMALARKYGVTHDMIIQRVES